MGNPDTDQDGALETKGQQYAVCRDTVVRDCHFKEDMQSSVKLAENAITFDRILLPVFIMRHEIPLKYRVMVIS